MDSGIAEVVILPEMEAAGTEVLAEARRQGLDDCQMAVAVYMAMRCVYLVAVLPKGSVH